MSLEPEKQEKGGLATKRKEMDKAKRVSGPVYAAHMDAQPSRKGRAYTKARVRVPPCFPRFALLPCSSPSFPPVFVYWHRRFETAVCFFVEALPSDNYARHRKSAKQGDEELLEDGEAGLKGDDRSFVFELFPIYVK
ncbi:hypothetical protein D9619_000031 [Psilocybe cf. subviscida]|uniref:Uncharacterized protein n=1 Tax=Psilocybe cf. subviscida TaxID=2480587 RepID=A0A8H5BCN8_9AGAR|nr:hypothetical protein D9619_000031 [Psilocybe cf. subviscida]